MKKNPRLLGPSRDVWSQGFWWLPVGGLEPYAEKWRCGQLALTDFYRWIGMTR